MLSRIVILPLGLLLVAAATASPTVYGKKCQTVEKRREWRNLTMDERASFVSALKCMADKPSVIEGTPEGFRHYDDYAWIHSRVAYLQHYVATFLAWHRWYIYTYHQSMKACGYTGPATYWSWDADYKDIPGSPIFSSDPKTGLGTNGTGVTNPRWSAKTVVDGGMANWYLRWPSEHHLTRNISTPPLMGGPDMGPYAYKNYAAKYMNSLYDAPTFKKFWPLLEGSNWYTTMYQPGFFHGPHGAIHFVISGDMLPPSSAANDPFFFMHHGNVDRVWAKWQDRDSKVRKDPHNPDGFSGNRIQNATIDDPDEASPFAPMGYFGLVEDVTAASVMDTRKWPLCYEYAD